MAVVLETQPKDLGKLSKELQKEELAKVKAALFRVAQVGINIVQDRTAQGIGYKGAFKPYSASYAAFRQKEGATLTPNLEMSGTMLAAMTSKANSRQAEIFFRGSTESEKAAHNDKIRPFLGFTREEEGRLARVFERAMK